MSPGKARPEWDRTCRKGFRQHKWVNVTEEGLLSALKGVLNPKRSAQVTGDKKLLTLNG